MPHLPLIFSSPGWTIPPSLSLFSQERFSSSVIFLLIFFILLGFFCSLPDFGSKGLWGVEQGGEHTEISSGAPVFLHLTVLCGKYSGGSPRLCPGKAQVQPVTSLQQQEVPQVPLFHNSKIRDGQRGKTLSFPECPHCAPEGSCSLWMPFPKRLPQSKQALCTEFQWAELKRLKSLILSGECQLYDLRRTKERRDNILFSPLLWKLLYCRTFVDLFLHISDSTTSVLATQYSVIVLWISSSH